MKPLEELSYAELMALFPIVLVPHRDEWREQYAREKARLLARLPGGDIFRLSHVGSTAIEGIWAKPTVDMVLEAADAAAFKRLDAVIPTCGYIRMRSGAGRVSFNRGYTPKGFTQEVFHLHLRLPGDADEVFSSAIISTFAPTWPPSMNGSNSRCGSLTNTTATAIPPPRAISCGA